MKLDIRGRRIEITERVRSYVTRRLAFALDRFADRIRMVKLIVGHHYSSQTGADESCQLMVMFMHSSPITLESHGLTVRRAVDRISGKVGNLVAERFARTRNRGRFRETAREAFE